MCSKDAEEETKIEAPSMNYAMVVMQTLMSFFHSMQQEISWMANREICHLESTTETRITDDSFQCSM